ncbi:GABA permease [Limosilactobacillus coleohominis DSM 14060]|nr:GABA permease [Limosilactobacillus coleohominis DSM 14060]
MVTIIMMILLGFMVIFFGFGNGGHPTGFSNLWAHGGFFTGGVKGFFFSMSIIVGSYEGIELLGISAGEVANPQKAIVKSVKSVLLRILIFYVGAIFVIVTIYPWNRLSAVGSPFVSTFAKVGITAAASIINFVVLTAALSGANSGIYSSSRMLFKLSHEGDAPKIFGRLSKRIVPDAAILGISGGILIGFILNMVATMFSKSTSDLFVVVFSSSVLPGMVPWFVILLAELKFRHNNPDVMENHPFKLPLYPLSNYFAFLMLFVIVIFMFINPDTRISVIVGATVLVIAMVVYLVRHKEDQSASH